MTEIEVKEYIGEENWIDFIKWMAGQTMGIVDGEPDYYDCDVKAFKEKIDIGYDKQDNPLAWD